MRHFHTHPTTSQTTKASLNYDVLINYKYQHTLQCSNECGGGEMSRYVACVEVDRHGNQVIHPEAQSGHVCDVNLKPANKRTCNHNPCLHEANVYVTPNDATTKQPNQAHLEFFWVSGDWSEVGCWGREGLGERLRGGKREEEGGWEKVGGRRGKGLGGWGGFWKGLVVLRKWVGFFG